MKLKYNLLKLNKEREKTQKGLAQIDFQNCMRAQYIIEIIWL